MRTKARNHARGTAAIRNGLLLFALISAVPVSAQDATEDAALRAGLEECQARPPAEVGACLEGLFRPTPEDEARQRASARAAAAHYARAAAAIAAGGGARELAFAATLQNLAASTRAAAADPALRERRVPDDPQAAAWRRAAAARAADDVLVQTLLLQAESDAPASAAPRWQALEPDNLAAWMASKVDIDVLLAAARDATRYDSHTYPRVRWMVQMIRAQPLDAGERAALVAAGVEVTGDLLSEEQALIWAMGMDTAVARPSWLPLMQACRDAALAATPTRRDDCRHIAGLLADRSDTAMAEGVGIGMLQRLAATPAERADADRRKRRFDWQMHHRVATPDASARFLRAFADPAIRTERELIARMLQEGGVAPEPPAGWQPRPYYE